MFLRLLYGAGQQAWGEGYQYAFDHFISGHIGWPNLFLHVLALALSLVAQVSTLPPTSHPLSILPRPPHRGRPLRALLLQCSSR